MPLTGAKQAVKDVLVSNTRFGLYSFPLWEWMSPFMKQILFGDEVFGQAKSTKITVKDIVLSPTTSQDGESIEWRTLWITKPQTTVNGAVDNSTAVILTDAKGFSVWDYIVFRDDTNWEIKAYITAINGNNITIDTAQTISDATPTVRIAYSKGKSAVIDRVDYDLEYETFSNYFQDFGAKKTFNSDLLNSNIDIDLNIGDYNKNPKELLKSKEVKESIVNYLQLEFGKKVGSEVLGDVEMAFISGAKHKWTVWTSVRRYTMGLEDIATLETIDTSTLTTKQEQFDAISDTVYDVINKSYQFHNKNVAVICNDAFYKYFMKLMQDKVQYTQDVNSSGNLLNKITFVDGRTIELSLIPAMDIRYATTPTAFVIPMDLIGAYTKKYRNIDASSTWFTPKETGADILIQKNISDQDTLDTFSFSIYYQLWFIFWWAETGIYKKIIVK